MNAIFHLLRGERVIKRETTLPAQSSWNVQRVDCDLCNGEGYALQVVGGQVKAVKCPGCRGYGFTYISTEAQHA